MQHNRGNEEKDNTICKNKSPENINQNAGIRSEEKISNVPFNRSTKITTKISKLIYDPPNQSTRAIIKSTHTYGNKVPSIVINEPQQLENDSMKSSKCKTRDLTTFPEQKLSESDNRTPINKNNEFLKKKLEREKDIEDIQKMLNQITTSCHENNEELKNSSKIISATSVVEDNLLINTIETNSQLCNESKINIPVNSQIEFNLNINDIRNNVDVNINTSESLLNQVAQSNSQNIKQNIQKFDLSNYQSESDLNLRRSQTDMNLKTKFLLSPKKPISSRTGTTRSKSSINLFSRDSSKAALETATKKKSYDPNEARRFMKEQRLKRKQIKNEQKSNLATQDKTNVASAAIDKMAIKKRLEDLRKSTLRILEKNVKIKEKQQIKKTVPYDVTSNPDTLRSNKAILKQSNSRKNLKLEKPKRKLEITGKFVNKKIGLLRKPESEENSFSALKDFNINKENLIFNKTPTAIEIPENDQGFKKISDTIMFKAVPESIFENNKNLNSHENTTITKETKIVEAESNNQKNDLELMIPDKKLERKVSLREKSVQVDDQPTQTVKNTKQNDLPYWLKPTPVQYYPYNFIMAVRKKLEAITNPLISDNIKHQKHTNKNYNDKTQETPLSYPKDRKEAVRRRIIDGENFNVNGIDSTDPNLSLKIHKKTKDEKAKTVENEKDNCGLSSKSLSEITSNFSSISIHIPESHTISDISSIRSDAVSNKKSQKHLVNSTKKSDQGNNKLLNKLNFIHEDDTTISSSVFSSPEKKLKKTNSTNKLHKNFDVELNAGPLSPLYVDNINKLKIKSKSSLEKVNLERGSSNNFKIPKLEINTEGIENHTNKTNSSRSVQKSENLELSQLLEDFNKSLSQVIEVNQQLKETLKKSNQMFTPNNKYIDKPVRGKCIAQDVTENYASDFEKDSSQTLKQNSEKSYNESNPNKNLKPAIGSIQSKTDEYTSDFEEEVSSVSHVENTARTSNSTTAKSQKILNIPQPKSVITSNISEKLPAISSNKQITEKFNENYNNSQVEEISNQSQLTNTTQEFFDSIEESSKKRTISISEHIPQSVNNEIIENVIIEEEISDQKNNESINHVYKHDLDNSVSQSKDNFIKNHINNSRGDFNTNDQNEDLNSNTTTHQIESNTGPPPAYIKPENIQTKEEITNSSNCSEFIAVFNQSDIAVSIYSQNESSVSEATLNYSSIGMYEQLLQTETSKSDQLAALLKMREKALMDRTKGQIAWLEVQKEKYKSKGLSAQISHIRKKQRAILIKMEKEREEIKKLIENQQSQVSGRSIINDRQQHKIRSYRPKLAENISDITIRKNSNRTTTIKSSNKIIRGIEIQSNPNLEIILQKREEELRKRRAHVECLMEWHQRLDKEEEEVFKLERILFENNSVPQKQKQHQQQQQQQQQQLSKHHTDLHTEYEYSKPFDALKKGKKIYEINKSLRELQNISSRSTDSTATQNYDYVRTTGNKLNKLWRRLTGQKNIEKFEINKKYKLYKNDLEKLYEQAKKEVLREFGNQHEMMELFEQSKFLETTANSLNSQSQMIVPRLNLNFSSGQSDIDHTNSSSVFYESTIQKQFQSSDLVENIEEYSKTSNLTSDILLSKINDKSEDIIKSDSEKLKSINEKETLEISTNENSLKNKIVEENSIIKTKIIPENLIEIHMNSMVNNTIDQINLSVDYNSSSSTMQRTKITDFSDITDNKTSDDVTSLSLEEQYKSFENCKSVLKNSSENSNLLPHIFSTSDTKIESNVDKSVQNTITDKILDEINSLNENVDRASVIVNTTVSKEINSGYQNIIECSDLQSNVDANVSDVISENTQPLLIPSPIEEVVKESETINSDLSKLTEETSKNGELIEEISNLENTDTKLDNSDILEKYDTKSDSIKSEIVYNKDQLSEKYNSTVSPEKSISSEYIESPKMFDDSKAFSESPSNETFVLSGHNLTNSPISTNTLILKASEIETPQSIDRTEEYENDFSGSEVTFLEDITEPKFELTMEDTKSILEESNLDENQSNDEKLNSTTELEKRLIDLDVSLKDLHNTFDRALSPDKNSITPPLSPVLLSLTTLLNKSPPDDSNIKLDLEKTKYSLPTRDYLTNNETATTLMPDIINEVEIRRRQQILIESEIKQLEQTMPPYVFLREIPNKPPPPYVPPAHGSPMTIIFPSEPRIKEITFQRTKELYDEILKTDKNTNKNDDINSALTISILDENITNIYERIILDICKECMQEYQLILTNLNPETYKNSLAHFNPPNRLKCMQEFVYRHVRKLLSMEKKSNILQKNSIITIGRKKRDNVDEILIQELYEEEPKWTNFDQEEEEVKLAIVDEILNDIVKDVVGEITDINEKKLEFLTNYSSVN